ncbi:DDB1- and CUL4-associated factor 10 homolog [Octopus bimaculoides]|uniref:Uncharacterized protein n=1 Tax=Octopus bimaculoides TaxID=37653 RepID=A0A0L8HV00_OCTBM|nr:DDB1- and CUL4-associated factor 10 homolog [Octopus bimaculoides]|eukprot:XP_014769417.1 PREDICTED: DDB1- and CUL4-associated factor 10 homolog [Octopus bimaculoides]
MASYSTFEPWRWQRKRELGLKHALGDLSQMYCGLYSSFEAVQTWEPDKTSEHTHHGGIFNFDFSPEGSILVAACERQSILLFDPFNAKLIGHKSRAHTDCVNCVRFLDSRVFATCSDDTTVSLWDVRYLRHEIRTLRGHSNWVKNIEYDADHCLLLTSGFDGSIYTWDINSYSVNEPNFKRVFHTSGLMRSKLTPDSSKIVISTTEGYLIVIHNLDLSYLEQDLRGFKPKFYRFMQLEQIPRRNSTLYNHVFERHRNRVEFISDFPGRDEACVIASLQIHPQGWCCLSRSTSSDENSEWTCLHDIQEIKMDTSVDEQDFEDFDEEMLDYSPQPSTSSGPVLGRPIGSMSPIPTRSPSPTSNSRSSSPSWLIYVRVQSPTPENSASDDDDNNHHERDDYDDDDDDNEGGGRGRGDGSDSDFLPRGRVNPSRPTRNRILYYRTPRVDLSPSSFSTSHQQRQSIPGNNPVRGSNASSSQTDNRSRNVTNGTTQDRSSTFTESMQPTNSFLPAQQQEMHRSATTSNSNRHETVNSSSLSSSSSRHHSSRGEVSSMETGRPEASTSGSSSRMPADYTLIFRAGQQPHQQQKRMLAVCSGVKSCPSHLYRIHKNQPRLLYYSEEPNVGRGFIKELCFSSDGRLICSPFGFGTRLLAFNPQCLELPDCVPQRPLKMCEVACNMAHTNVVVTAKFAPNHCMYVAGCLNGRVTFHQPVL